MSNCFVIVGFLNVDLNHFSSLYAIHLWNETAAVAAAGVDEIQMGFFAKVDNESHSFTKSNVIIGHSILWAA